jgi:glycosyltransferase involved in cell wall biosynthesis
MTGAARHKTHLLLFEPDARGHAPEWIEHLLTSLAALERRLTVSVAVPSSLAAELSGWTRRRGAVRVRMLPLRPRETALCNSRWLAVSAFTRWWSMRTRLRQTGADHGIFLCMDHLSLPFGMGFQTGKADVSGVLFRPSLHYPREPHRAPTLGERVRDFHKAVLYPLMLRNPAIRVVWSLDPHFPAFAAQRYRHGYKVRPAPDPAYPFDKAIGGWQSEGDELPEPLVPPGRTRFLIFGVLSERKGMLALVDALRRMEPRYAASVAVTAVGTIDPAIESRLDAALSELRETRPEIWMRFDNRRLTMEEIAAHIASSDVVLAPYQRFVGSSGVMLWAAGAGKPLITQSYGLLGRLTRDFRLGADIDTSDPSEIAAAMVTAIRNGPRSLADPVGMTRFVESHSPEIFTTRILDGVLGSAWSPIDLKP